MTNSAQLSAITTCWSRELTLLSRARENKQRTQGGSRSHPETLAPLNRENTICFHNLTSCCCIASLVAWAGMNNCCWCLSVIQRIVLSCPSIVLPPSSGGIHSKSRPRFIDSLPPSLTRPSPGPTNCRGDERRRKMRCFSGPRVMLWVSFSYLVRRSKYMSDVFQTSN